MKLNRPFDEKSVRLAALAVEVRPRDAQLIPNPALSRPLGLAWWRQQLGHLLSHREVQYPEATITPHAAAGPIGAATGASARVYQFPQQPIRKAQ
jgi:hypothetical protein